MNREIKFREWETERKTMAYGKRLDFDDSVHFRFAHEEGGERILMQYTGLKDKNGVDVYEGDILTGQLVKNHHRKAVVIFSEGAFRFVEFWQEGLLTEFEEHSNTLDFFYNLEIIGNIYENPELLQGDAE